MIEANRSPIEDPSIQRAELAAAIETPDPEHSLHVTHLALRLYDQLRDELSLPAEGRDLLAAAALWHDAGQSRCMEEHHRKSFDLILARKLLGFSSDEQLQIANIARYHRRAGPSREHPGYRNLSRQLRPAVDRMAALLRIAEALDAGHLQAIEDLRCEAHPSYVTVRVIAAGFPMLELERASERAGLFKEVFRRDIEFIPTGGRNSSQSRTVQQ